MGILSHIFTAHARKRSEYYFQYEIWPLKNKVAAIALSAAEGLAFGNEIQTWK